MAIDPVSKEMSRRGVSTPLLLTFGSEACTELSEKLMAATWTCRLTTEANKLLCVSIVTYLSSQLCGEVMTVPPDVISRSLPVSLRKSALATTPSLLLPPPPPDLVLGPVHLAVFCGVKDLPSAPQAARKDLYQTLEDAILPELDPSIFHRALELKRVFRGLHCPIDRQVVVHLWLQVDVATRPAVCFVLGRREHVLLLGLDAVVG